MKTRSMFLFIFILAVVGLTVNASGSNKSAALQPISPKEEASVHMNFDGLMTVCFGDPARVSAGFLDVHHHTPEIVIAKIENGKSRTIAKLSGDELRGSLYFDVEGESKTAVSRYYGDLQSDQNDFRWNIDLEGDLYQRQLYIKEEKLFGKIHFSSGLFYSDNLTDKPVRFYAADDMGKAHPFNRRVGAPAAKLNLALGDALVIKSEKQTLRFKAESGVRYEIRINNLPPSDMANLDHWLFYYDVVGSNVTKYMPVMIQKAAFGPRPMLCDPVIFSKSKLN